MPSFPTTSVSAAPGLRLRPVPELGLCLAYDPPRARLHRLNATAWLILSLCDGRPREVIAGEFGRAMRALPGPPPEQGAFSRGLARLVALGLVTLDPPQSLPPSPPAP